MLQTIKTIFMRPEIKDNELKSYSINFPMDRLRKGVDNSRYDVYFSKDFQLSVSRAIFSLFIKYTKTDSILNLSNKSLLIKDIKNFRKLCYQIILYGINRAKVEKEGQIDTLMLVSLIKLILQNIQEQYNVLLTRLRNLVREYENSINHNEAFIVQNKINLVTENRKDIMLKVGNELFNIMAKLQKRHLGEIRKAYLGEKSIMLDDLFPNPILCADDPFDEFFTLKYYDILLDCGLEESDKYGAITAFIRRILKDMCNKKNDLKKNWGRNSLSTSGFENDINKWMMNPDNIDILLNCFQSKYKCSLLDKNDKNSIKTLKLKSVKQKNRLNFFYKKFKRAGILNMVVASYEMQPLYLDYCPPLMPHLVSHYLVSAKVKKYVSNHIKRLKKIYKKPFSLSALNNKRKELRHKKRNEKKGYLIRYLRDFVKYHRDFHNSQLLKKAMEKVYLMSEPAMINLSRTNNTLYEFLLPHDRANKESKIIRHVILKADIRGSTEITHKMLEKGLNPATYFSLNLFNPISEIMGEYGAEKVFVEGDAIILSICERENMPEDWYCVSRACGLAMDIISIVENCNLNNRKRGLPRIEIGIGISYEERQPVFLFDGDHKIMISSAINKADRLSSCSKTVRNFLKNKKNDFNLYVFYQNNNGHKAGSASLIRYNVNGIELDSKGFAKLKQEISLERMNKPYDGLKNNSSRFYFGKFPLISRQCKSILIREANIISIKKDPKGRKQDGEKKYYEICNYPDLCGFGKNQAKGKNR